MLNLSDWPVSRRLFAVITAALLMGVTFGGLRVANAASTAAGFARTTQLAVLGEQVTALAQALENERDVQVSIRAVIDVESSSGYINAQNEDVPYVNGQREEVAKANAVQQLELLSAEKMTNAAAARVRVLAAQIGAAFPSTTSAKASAVVADIDDLPGLRSQMAFSPPSSALAAYSATIADLFALNDEITSGSADPVLDDEVRTLGWISRAKDQASQQRAILYTGLLEDTWANVGGDDVLTTAQGLENADVTEFQTSASLAVLGSFTTAVVGPEVNTTQLLSDYTGAIGQPYTSSLSSAPRLWYSSSSGTITGMRKIETQLASAIVARSQQLQLGARQAEVLAAGVTGAALLIVLMATLIVARSLVEPLRRLKAGALEVASVQLPERVRLLNESPDSAATMEVVPINVVSDDEIGQVARAFDQVHGEAVRLASEQALLRASFNATFVDLSRRSQSLIERLARTIDALEQSEDDPDRLGSLFSMDHLVTRMRRNSANLLLLAGHENPRKWSDAVPLADVTRAAISEIEQYKRVVLNVPPGISVIGQAASDSVHLLAELVENATMFSPQDTKVTLTTEELSGGVLIEILDRGIGVSEARLADMNFRLDNPPKIDASVSRHMGLFAVARLAERHGVRVRLRTAAPQGLSALVWLPDPVIEHTDRHGSVQSWSSQPSGAQSIVGTRQVGADMALDDDGAAMLTREGHRGNGGGLAGREPRTASGWFRRRGAGGGPAPRVPAAPGPAVRRVPGESHVGLSLAGQTSSAGLPVRTPGGSQAPGVALSAQAGPGTQGASRAFATGGSDPGRPTPSRGPVPRGLRGRDHALPQRSPDQARSRLAGFQRGDRRAEEPPGRTGQFGQAQGAGEESER